MSGLPGPVGRPASPHTAPALAALRLLRRLRGLPTAAAQAALLADQCPSLFAAPAAAVFLCAGSRWTAYYGPAISSPGVPSGIFHEQAWIDRAAAALLDGRVPNELQQAVGETPARWHIEVVSASAMAFGALAVCLPEHAPPEAGEALAALAGQLAETCQRERERTGLVPTEAVASQDRAELRLARDEAQRRVQELEGLREISGLARLGIPADEFYNALTQRVARLVRADSCVISEWDSDARVYRPLGGTGRSPRATPVGSALPDETNRLTAAVIGDHATPITPDAADPAARRLAQVVQERIGFAIALGVRLSVDGQTVGALVALRRAPTPRFTEDDGRLLEIIATQAAQEVQRFRMDRALENRIRELQGLWEISRLGQRQTSSRAYYRDLVEQIARLFDADASFLLRLDAESKTLVTVGAFGFPEDHPAAMPRVDASPDSPVWPVLTERATLLRADTADPGLRPFAEANHALGFDLALDVGLIVEGRVLGALGVLRRDGRRAFTNDDIRLIEIVAAQLAQDIESFRLRRALQRAFDTRDAVVRHLPDAIVVYNRQGRIISVNAVAQRMTNGVAAEGKTVDDMRAGFAANGVQVAGSDDPLERITWTLREGYSTHHERLTILRPGRPEQIVDFSCAPILDEQGQVDGAVAVFRDVTEQHDADRRNEELLIELEASESRFRAIINHIDSAVLVRDGQTVLYTNEKYRQLFGLEQDVVGMRVDDLARRLAPYFARSEEYLGRLIATDDLAADAYTMLVELHYPERRYVERISSPLRGGDGEVFGRLIVYRDLTREHDLMDQRDRFLADTALVLRGDLGLPQGELARLLGELNSVRADAGGRPEASAQIAEIEARIRRVNDEIADVIARIGILRDLPLAQRGELTVVAERHDLTETVQAALRSIPGLNPARLVLEGLDQGPVVVQGHRARLMQIVGWLAENAVAYSTPGSPVTVRLHRTADGYARLTVADRGLGLDREEAEHLFTCYYRSPRAAHAKPRGMGVSLYLARETVRLLGGSLWAESAGPRRGTTFVLEVPLADGGRD